MQPLPEQNMVKGYGKNTILNKEEIMYICVCLLKKKYTSVQLQIELLFQMKICDFLSSCPGKNYAFSYLVLRNKSCSQKCL